MSFGWFELFIMVIGSVCGSVVGFIGGAGAMIAWGISLTKKDQITEEEMENSAFAKHIRGLSGGKETKA